MGGPVFDEYDMMNIKEDFNNNNNNNKQDIRYVVDQESVHNNVDHEVLINLINNSSINQWENGLVTSEEKEEKAWKEKDAKEKAKKEQEVKARKKKETAENEAAENARRE